MTITITITMTITNYDYELQVRLTITTQPAPPISYLLSQLTVPFSLFRTHITLRICPPSTSS
ncbi:MAG TPA: hypothetical protein PLK89_16920, partial [Acidobacteriota bacterium]|nr:hypothetical protein [Acidobacteriota bacterium]